jgi:hypothetical protein
MSEVDLEQRLACIEDAVRLLNRGRVVLEGRCFALEQVLAAAIDVSILRPEQRAALRKCAELAHVAALNSIESDPKVAEVGETLARILGSTFVSCDSHGR